MAVRAQPGEQYTVRRKFFNIAGASFHVLNAEGTPIGFCRQKAFRLREDIRLYTDSSKSQELLSLTTRQIIDFGATYDVRMPEGDPLCSLRRSGVKSSLLRDEWSVFDPENQQLATIREQGSVTPLLRRYWDGAAILFPQRYHVERTGDGTHLATFRQHFNPFIFRMGVAVHEDDERFDELMLIGAVSLIAAIEGRQS